jgi:hypothetical protein
MTQRYDYDIIEIEMGSPEKFKGLELNAHCKVEEILRAGTFEQQKDLYPDELILKRIVDQAGQSPVRFTGSSRPANSAHWMQFRANMDKCMANAIEWRATVMAWLDEIADHEPNVDVTCHLYSPCDLMASLVFGWPSKINSFLPAIRLEKANSHSGNCVARGGLVWDSTRAAAFFEAVYAVYPDPLDWVTCRQFGIVWDADRELLETLNLRYAVIEFVPEQSTALLECEDGQLRRIPFEIDPDIEVRESSRPLFHFFQHYTDKIASVVDYFRSFCHIS